MSTRERPPPIPVSYTHLVLFWLLGVAALVLSAVGRVGGIAVLQMAALALAVLFLFVGSTYFLNFLFTRSQLKSAGGGEDDQK